MTARQRPLHRIWGLLLCALLSLAGTLPADAGEDRTPRHEKFISALRATIAALGSEDASAREGALRTVGRSLGRKNASSHRWLTPTEYTQLAEGAFDEALSHFRSDANGQTGALALGVLAGLSRHAPETKHVVAQRVEELRFLFDVLNRSGMRSLLEALTSLGTPADALAPQIEDLLTGSDRTLQRQAGVTLGMIGGSQARAALRRGGGHASKDVRYAAYRGRRFLLVLSVWEVQALLADVEDARVGPLARATCIAFMGRIDGETGRLRRLAAELAQIHLASSEQSLRRAGCNLLGAIGPPAQSASARLAALSIDDPDSQVRLDAARSLGRVDPSEEGARRIMAAAEAPRNRTYRLAFVKLLRLVSASARPVLPRLENLITETEDQRLAYATRQMIREIEREGLYLRSRILLEAGTERVRSLAWSSAGERLAAGASDRTLRIWQPDRSEPVARLLLPRYG